MDETRSETRSQTRSSRDEPWLMRTYSGHSTARASNELYRNNLAKGQTGLSIAFDLPTQTGYDPDDPKARGEVGKVGVPVVHLGHMRTLLDHCVKQEEVVYQVVNAAGNGFGGGSAFALGVAATLLS